MRWLVLLLLALSGLAFSPPTTTLPRGNERFHLGWTRDEVDSAVSARGLQPLTSGVDFITTPGEEPEVEYIEYSFVPQAHGPGLLWKVVWGYRVPYDRQMFDGARGTLVGDLGPPADEHQPDPKNGDFVEQLTWADALTTVQLGARWSERQDARVDRMLVTWIDRQLQKKAAVKTREQVKSKKK